MDARGRYAGAGVAGDGNAEALSPVDRAWLGMDEPHNPMVASALFQLEGAVRPAAVAQAIAARLLRFDRFRCRVDRSRRTPRWLEDEVPDPAYHVQLRRLPGRDPGALRAAVATELTRPLEPFRPLWQVVLFARRGAPLTLLFRAHHALADGIALLHVLLECSDAAVRRRRSPAAAPARPRRGPLARLIGQFEAADRALEALRRLALDDLRHPQHLARQLAEGRHLLAVVGRLLRLPQDNPPALRRPLGGHRAVAWIDGLPLKRFSRAAAARGVKLNDLFMALVACAVGDYLRAAGLPPQRAQNLRISIPVNLRGGDAGRLGNCFGLVLLDLPVGVAEPLQCLELVARRMQALKDGGEARAVLLGLEAAGHLPVLLEQRLVHQVAGKAAAVVSNLRGPPRPLRFAGATLRNPVFWPPQSGGIGLGISLFTYAGRLSIGISADTALVPDPDVLLAGFRRAIAALTAAQPA